MRKLWYGLAAVAALFFVRGAWAQVDVTAQSLSINASEAYTWMQESTSIIQLEGPVAIDLDKTHLSAKQAVIWMTPVPRSVANVLRVEIVLLGDARIVDPESTMSNPWLYVEVGLRGTPRITATRRTGVNQGDSPLYKQASSHRPVMLSEGQPSERRIMQPEGPPAMPSTRPASEFRPLRPVEIHAEALTTEKMKDGRIAVVIPGKLTILRTEKGDFLELIAERGVVFTPFLNLSEVSLSGAVVEQVVTGAYLEGDVQIMRTPKDQTQPEQRATCNRAFYDFTTDRAVMTNVVLQTYDPKAVVPIVVRAQLVRQLSQNDNTAEYTAEHGLITTSSFNTPSYSIGARSIYIKQWDINDPITGTRTEFVAHDATFDIGGVPVFYSPILVGDFAEHEQFRRVETSGQHAFGLGVMTEWGLFETLHRLPPKGTDASYQIGYFSKRGPALGLNGQYVGGVADEATLEPWSYSGDFKSFLVFDTGVDDLGKRRVDVDPESEVRGRLLWQHQQFLPGDWQVQLTGAYLSDPTFLEQWFNREFRTNEPYQNSIYAKHQSGSEAYTFLLSAQLNDFATVSDAYQEQAEVERLPELSYLRIGDSLLDDHATFFSANTLSALKFRNSDESLGELGFGPAQSIDPKATGYLSPGIPSYGFTGTPEDTTYRGDFRQELDFPFTMYRFRVVPYLVGRYTDYSESVDGGSKERLMVAGGARMTTAFWKVDDTVESALFDLHRLRHVIEPELNVYGSAQTADRDNFLIYDEPIDAVTDISAVQIGVNQRWQTKRGGPGQWRSADVFTLDVQGNFFFNQPPDSELNPQDFRGLYFASKPEASVPRNSVNAQFSWQVSDSVQVLSDIYYNLDKNTLATTSIGLSVRHDPRLSYYLGLRHIGVDLEQLMVQDGQKSTFFFDDEDLIILATDYQLTSKYRVALSEAYDVAQDRQNSATMAFIRHFDRFFFEVGFRLDAFQSGSSSVFVNVWPEGMEPPRSGSAAAGGIGGAGGGILH